MKRGFFDHRLERVRIPCNVNGMRRSELHCNYLELGAVPDLDGLGASWDEATALEHLSTSLDHLILPL